MNKKSSAVRTTGRVVPYADFLLEWMRQKVVATAQEVERAIFEKFEDNLNQDDFSIIPTTGIVKWRNDVHWARARLTEQQYTVTVGDWFILLPDRRGSWDVQALCRWQDAAAIIRKVAGQLPKVPLSE